MQERTSGVHTAEKIAGVVSVVAALVVINGAWQNQHNWQNLSWRVAIAAVLVALAVVVETNTFGFVRARAERDAELVPDFMRSDASLVADGATEREPTHADTVNAADRR